MQRIAAFDVLRGLALLLMILDHAVIVFGWADEIRHLTRLAMPMFMVLSGYLFRYRLGRRYAQVWIAALMSWPVAVVLDVAAVPILVIYAALLPLLLLPVHWVLIVAVLGALQLYNWPIAWQGYQPGYVFLFLALGRIYRLIPRNSRLTVGSGGGPLVWMGRYPLFLYVAHLWVLFAIQDIQEVIA